MRLLLLSNSKNPGQGYLEHALPIVGSFLGQSINRVLFIPYASVIRTFADYEAAVADRFSTIGYSVRSIHHSIDPREAVEAAQAIAVGGGNTFHLLRRLYDENLLDVIRRRVAAGVPYIGWSAGSNIACPTIRTTNDMPIIEPPSLAALGLVPFQINPHYLDAHPEGHQGETREERLREYIEVNEGVRVVGLREGSILRVDGGKVELIGSKTARLFVKGAEPREYAATDSLDFLL